MDVTNCTNTTLSLFTEQGQSCLEAARSLALDVCWLNTTGTATQYVLDHSSVLLDSAELCVEGCRQIAFKVAEPALKVLSSFGEEKVQGLYAGASFCMWSAYEKLAGPCEDACQEAMHTSYVNIPEVNPSVPAFVGLITATCMLAYASFRIAQHYSDRVPVDKKVQ